MYIHICMAHVQFGNLALRHSHQVVQVAFKVQVVSVLVLAVCVCLVGVSRLLSTLSISAESVLSHFGKEGSCSYDIHRPLQGVIPLQPSPAYAQESPLPAGSVVGHRHKVT